MLGSVFNFPGVRPHNTTKYGCWPIVLFFSSVASVVLSKTVSAEPLYPAPGPWSKVNCRHLSSTWCLDVLLFFANIHGRVHPIA